MSWKYPFKIIICLTLLNSSLCGQKSIYHYKPINISDSSLQWVYVLKDTLFRPNNSNGVNKLTPYSNLIGPYKVLYQNNKLYIIYYSWYGSIDGIYVEKINLGSGISERLFTWDKRSNGGVRERYENAHIRPDGKLEIITSRMPDKKFTPQLGVITLDTFDLTMLNHSYSPFSDTNSIRIACIYSSQRWLPLTIPIGDSLYINYQQYREVSEQNTSKYHHGIRAVTINNKGRFISDTIALYFNRNYSIPLSVKNNNQQKLIKNVDGSITLFQYLHYDNDSTYAELFNFDRNLNMLERQNFTQLFDKYTVFSHVQNTTKDNLMVLAYNYADGAPFSQYYTGMILDRWGNLIEKFNLLDANNKSMIFPVVTKLVGLQGSFIMSSAEDPYRLDIWDTQGNGKLRLLKSFEFEEGYYMSPQKIVELPNDELLLFTYFNRDTIIDGTNKYLLYASAIIKFKRKNLGLSTGTKIVPSSSQLTLICSPNPSSDLVELDFNGLFTGRIEIVNNVGRIIESHDINKQKLYKLSMSLWAAGLYHINAYQRDQNGGSYGTIKLVKE